MTHVNLGQFLKAGWTTEPRQTKVVSQFAHSTAVLAVREPRPRVRPNLSGAWICRISVEYENRLVSRPKRRCRRRSVRRASRQLALPQASAASGPSSGTMDSPIIVSRLFLAGGDAGGRGPLCDAGAVDLLEHARRLVSN